MACPMQSLVGRWSLALLIAVSMPQVEQTGCLSSRTAPRQVDQEPVQTGNRYEHTISQLPPRGCRLRHLGPTHQTTVDDAGMAPVTGGTLARLQALATIVIVTKIPVTTNHIQGTR